jgi:hypothetical protein
MFKMDWVKWRHKFADVLRSPWTQTVIGAVLGIGLAWASEHIHVYFQRRPFHAIWDNILGEQRTIPIAIGGITRPGYFIPLRTNSKVVLPSNVPLFGVQEGMGVSVLREALVSTFGEGSVKLNQYKDFGPLKTDSFVSIGGASVNEVTYNLLVTQPVDTKFKMVYPDHYAVDDGQVYRAEQQDGLITKDYGFIIVAPNPYDAQKTVCLAFGIWPQGTNAALYFLSHPEDVGPKSGQFTDLLRKHKGAVVVVETNVYDFTVGHPTLVHARELAPPTHPGTP